MLKLIIEDDEGRKTTVPFVREEITIGRQEGNTIRLTERNVSRRHARLLKTQDTITVEDLGSYNGIKVNGERIHGQIALQEGDLVQIGDYGLAIEDEGAKTKAGDVPASTRPTDDLTQPYVAPLQRVNSTLAVTSPSIPVTPVSSSDIPAASDADFEEAPPTDAHQAQALDSRATESLTAATGPVAAKASGPLPMLLGLMGLLAGAAIAVWLLKPRESPIVDAPVVKIEGSAQVKAESPAPKVEDFKPRLDAAQVAIRARQWDKAKDILESCKTSDGNLISQASKLLNQMQSEESLKRKLDLAEAALEEGRIQEAGQLLKASESTQLLAVQHLELTAQWEDAAAAARKQSAPTQEQTREKAPRLLTTAIVEKPSALFEQGVSFFRSDRMSDARREFEKCIKADAAFAPCHKGLGGVFAKMGETEKGAKHYKTFLKLAPNDKDAAAVRAIVNTYEATLQKN